MPWVLLYRMSKIIQAPCLEFWSGFLFSGERQYPYPYEDYINQGLGPSFLLSCTLSHPTLYSLVPSSTDQLYFNFFWIIFVPFRTCSLLVSTLSPPLPHFSAELFLTSYVRCSCSLHISPYLHTLSLLSKFSIVPASFHSALCQCSSQITKAVSEISLTRALDLLKCRFFFTIEKAYAVFSECYFKLEGDLHTDTTQECFCKIVTVMKYLSVCFSFNTSNNKAKQQVL